MGNSNEKQSLLKKGQGLRLLSIKVNSPFDGKAQPFFDFIIDIIPLEPSRSPKQILNQLAGQEIKKSTQNQDFNQIITENQNKKVQFKIVSTKDRNVRSVEIVPNRNWNGSMDLIGIQVRKQRFDDALDTYFPVTDVAINSPMFAAGVKAGEYLLGCLQFQYSNLNNFTQGIYDRFFDKQVQDKHVHLALYDMVKDQLSIKPILLRRGWGGKGLLGCEFLQGQIYKFPPNWRERRADILQSQKKKLENLKLKQELGECDGASKTLVEALKNKRNRKGKHLQTIKNMISFPLPQIPVPNSIQHRNQREDQSHYIDYVIVKEQNLKIETLQKRVCHLQQTLSNIKLYLDQLPQEQQQKDMKEEFKQATNN